MQCLYHPLILFTLTSVKKVTDGQGMPKTLAQMTFQKEGWQYPQIEKVFLKMLARNMEAGRASSGV